MIDQDSVDVDISFVNDEAVFSYWKGHENFRKELFELSNMKDIEKIHSFAEHLIWGHCEEPWMRKTLEVGQIRCDYARILMAVVKSFLNSTKDFRQLELSSFEEEFGHFNCLDGSIDALVKMLNFSLKSRGRKGAGQQDIGCRVFIVSWETMDIQWKNALLLSRMKVGTL